MHRALENDRVGNTRLAQRVHCFFIFGRMWTGRLKKPGQFSLSPFVLDNGGALRVDDPFAADGTTTLEFVVGMTSHHEVLWKEAA